jgi:hypothetical protein
MAKGQVSEEELTKGLKGIGNFGGLSPKVQRDNPFRDSRSDKAEQPKTIDVRSASEPQTAKARIPDAAKPGPKPLRTLTPAPKERAENLRSEDSVARKADIFTERVTLQISPDMRDEIDGLARDLQRARTTKEERITANTVMRVALQLLMKNYQFERGDVANNEAELYDLIVRRFRKK